MTFRRVVFPLSFPGIVAGSIFTFSLTLGDYIAPSLVGNTKFIGNVIYDIVGVASNLPLAAAYALVPVAIMAIYLFVAKQPRRVRGVGGRMESRLARLLIKVGDGRHAAVPLHPARDPGALRVQRQHRPVVADPDTSRRSGSAWRGTTTDLREALIGTRC